MEFLILFSVKNKNILLTGSTGHIGFTLAKSLLKRNAHLICPIRNNLKKEKIEEAGLIQLTKFCAVHLAKYKIRVNAISPGPFPNEKVQKRKSFIKKLEANVPMKRIGLPEELIGTVLYLLTEASSYTTGQNIIVDGGWTVK